MYNSNRRAIVRQQEKRKKNQQIFDRRCRIIIKTQAKEGNEEFILHSMSIVHILHTFFKFKKNNRICFHLYMQVMCE